MKLRFNSETAHQKAAVVVIVDLFEGQLSRPPQAAYTVARNSLSVAGQIRHR